jgi:hypothetical protein
MPYLGCFCKSERLLAPTVFSFQGTKKTAGDFAGVSCEESVAANPGAI